MLKRIQVVNGHLQPSSTAQQVPPLAEDTAALCAQLVAAGEGQPKSWEVPIEAPRSSYRTMMKSMGHPIDAVCSVIEDHTVPTGSVPVRYYRPAAAAANETLPVCLYYHGGGWTQGDVEGYTSIP